jgi:hypothetical protein
VGTVCAANGTVVAQAQQTRPIRRAEDHTERRANAVLIAAAPDLLEMLGLAERAIFELTRSHLIENGCPRGHTASKKAAEDAFVLDIRAAIAKAEGRSA